MHRTLAGEYLVSGTLFLDCRNAPDLSDFNSIIYGHHMKNGTMFADLPKFDSDNYFETHKTGTMYLPYASHPLEIMAYLVVDQSDSMIYNPYAEKDELLAYIREHARQYRDIKLSADDTLLTISTCNYEYDGARSVVVARIIKK